MNFATPRGALGEGWEDREWERDAQTAFIASYLDKQKKISGVFTVGNETYEISHPWLLCNICTSYNKMSLKTSPVQPIHETLKYRSP